MATTTDVQPQVRMIALEQIRHDANVRELASEDVDALAGSIALLGQITPAIVRPDGNGYLLVAGHKRYAALQQLGHTEIRAEVRSGEGEHSERAAENVVRTQLNPYEEARAVAAMLANGLSEDGAAQALGWPKARVTARMRLLELPEPVQRMVGAGEIALSSVEQLRTIGHVSPALLDALIAYLADGNQFAAERLAREPGWVLDAALRQTDNKVFAAHLSRVDSHDLAALRLGKKTEALYERVVELARKLDRYSYGADIRFSEAEVDQARAAGVVIEFERGWPLIVDRSLYRELVKQAIARTVTELEARVAERAAEKHAQRRATAELPADPGAEARRDEQRALRGIAETAHGVNLDLGAGLLTGLSTVDPADMAVVIWRRRGASSTSLNLPSPASFEALSAVRLPCRPRRWTGGCRISIDPPLLSRRWWLPLPVDRRRASGEPHQPRRLGAENVDAGDAPPRAWACRSPSQETVSGVSSSSGRSGCVILR
jgi:ParB/RepB/Spo0J family partition protein